MAETAVKRIAIWRSISQKGVSPDYGVVSLDELFLWPHDTGI